MLTWIEEDDFLTGKLKPSDDEELDDAAGVSVVGELFRGAIRQLVFGPDEELLVVAGSGVEILDPKTLKTRSIWLKDERVLFIAAADDRLFVAVKAGNKVALHLSNIGEALGEPLLEMETKYLNPQVACNQEGTLFAVADYHTAQVWELDKDGNKNLKATFELEDYSWSETLKHIELSEDGKYLLGFCPGKFILTWELDAEELIYNKSSFVPDSVNFLPAHRLLVGGRKLRVRDWSTGTSDDSFHETFKQSIKERTEEFDLDKFQFLFRAGRLVGTNPFGQTVELSPDDGSLVAHAQGRQQHYGSMANDIKGTVSPNYVASYAETYGELRIFDGQELVARRGYIARTSSFDLSADTNRLVLRSPFREQTVAVDREAGIMKTAHIDDSDKELSLKERGDVAVSPDGSSFLMSYSQSDARSEVVYLHSWGKDGGEHLHGGGKDSTRIEFIDDEHYVVVEGSDKGAGRVCFYRLGASRMLFKLTQKKSSPLAMEFSPSGELVAVGWSNDSTTIYDLTEKKPKLVETIEARGADLGWIGDSKLVIGSNPLTLWAAQEGCRQLDVTFKTDFHPARGWPLLTVSPDGRFIFIGRQNGTLEIRSSHDGALQDRLVVFTRRFEALQVKKGCLWATSSWGEFKAISIPGAAASEEEKTSTLAGHEEEEEPEALPKIRPWRLYRSNDDGGIDEIELAAKKSFDLGSRVLTICQEDGESRIYDETGKRVKSLRQRKADDEEAFQEVKALWNLLREDRLTQDFFFTIRCMFFSGQSVTAEELREILSIPPAQTSFNKTFWRSLDGEEQYLLLDNEIKSIDGEPVSIPEDKRLVLLHQMEMTAKVHRASRNYRSSADPLRYGVHKLTARTPDSVNAVTPVNTEAALTPFPKIREYLLYYGCQEQEHSPYGVLTFSLQAPELGGIALVSILPGLDIPRLTFHPWDGTVHGGPPMLLEDVNPRLYSSAITIVKESYVNDRHIKEPPRFEFVEF